jgi:hypothetical protein
MHRLERSHLSVKLWAALFAHSVGKSNFVSRRFAGQPANDAVILPELDNVKTDTNYAPPIRGIFYDVGYWKEHSLFIAMPTMSTGQVGAGFMVPLVGKRHNKLPFDLHASLLGFNPQDIQIFSQRTELEFWDFMRRKEVEAGDKRLVQPMLTSLFRPPHTYREGGEIHRRLASTMKPADRVNAIMLARRERTFEFQQRLGPRKFRQICDVKTVERWVHTGARKDLARDVHERADSIRLRLLELVEMLQRFDSVEIALTDNNFSSDLIGGDRDSELDLSWLSDSCGRITLERQERIRRDLNETRIVIDNLSICRAFERKFDDAWERTPAREKDKQKIIERIRSWIGILDGQE